MNKCPNCHKKTLSIFESLNYYSKNYIKCSNCGANVRRTIRLSDFLVGIYLLSGVAASRFFKIDIDNNLWIYFPTAIILLFLQIRLIKYEVQK